MQLRHPCHETSSADDPPQSIYPAKLQNDLSVNENTNDHYARMVFPAPAAT
jgi:hypothetical protein